MQNILVPVDFSKDSINALEHGLKIANVFNLGLRIIHVRKEKSYDTPFVLKGKEKEYAKTTEEFCEEIVRKYKPQFRGSGTFDYVIRTGRIYKAITNQAEKDESMMIVMGTHGVSGFEETWLGSNAYRVVCNAPCPVVTIRYGYHKRSISRIVLPIDARQDTRVKVPFVSVLAKAFRAEVHVIDVRVTNARDVINRLKRYANQSAEYLETRGVKTVRDSLKGSSIADMTMAYAVHHEADLIAIVSSHRGNPLGMYLSSEAQDIVNHSPIPVLSIHPAYAKFK